ncbi:MAG: hypothetical protein ACXWCK_32815, partial [Burkholderiales bacterium]
ERIPLRNFQQWPDLTALAQQCRLASCESKRSGARVNQWNCLEDFINDPRIVLRFWRLRTHQAVVVASFSDQKIVVARIATI